jgi:hypothetical protein
MNNLPLIPGNSATKNTLLAKRPVKLGLLLLLLAVVASSFLYWARGADEKDTSSTKSETATSPASSASDSGAVATRNLEAKTTSVADTESKAASPVALLDTMLYDQLTRHMVNGDSSGHWPIKAGYPHAGAIFPFKRVVAFYGNLYSKRMGILGELEPTEMLNKLQEEVTKWKKADSTLEVIPGLHYIAVTAQSEPGKGGKYRLRMPTKQIDSVLVLAKKIDALVFLDIQVGLSTLEEEVPMLEKYLLMPNVHLGIDPEFSMKTGKAPGKVVGTFDAPDVNYASSYLANLVNTYHLPPKILVVHRFTQGMLTNYKKIEIRPQVQVVVDMDGWGERARKLNTYKQYVYKEPVQFTGFKLFYKNDTKSKQNMLTPEELLKLKPQPVYIQYQ